MCIVILEGYTSSSLKFWQHIRKAGGLRLLITVSLRRRRSVGVLFFQLCALIHLIKLQKCVRLFSLDWVERSGRGGGVDDPELSVWGLRGFYYFNLAASNKKFVLVGANKKGDLFIGWLFIRSV